MLSDWLVHTPLGVVAKNFGMNATLLTKMPAKDPYMLEATAPPPPLGEASEEAVKTPQGYTPAKYVFELSKQEKTMAPGGGGWVKIQDSVTNFPVSTQLASALVYVEPNGMRELHWHTADGMSNDVLLLREAMIDELALSLQNGFTSSAVQGEPPPLQGLAVPGHSTSRYVVSVYCKLVTILNITLLGWRYWCLPCVIWSLHAQPLTYRTAHLPRAVQGASIRRL